MAVCLRVFVSLLFLASFAAAQDPRGTIAGRVIDASNAVAPNVEVRVTNVETGVAAAARTNAAGIF